MTKKELLINIMERNEGYIIEEGLDYDKFLENVTQDKELSDKEIAMIVDLCSSHVDGCDDCLNYGNLTEEEYYICEEEKYLALEIWKEWDEDME